MATEQLTNLAYSTLGATITSGATTLTVHSATPFPTVPQFRLLIDSELMLVTGVSGTTFTVTRGIEGTSAAAHSAAVRVSQVLTVASLQAAFKPCSLVYQPGGTAAGNVYTTWAALMAALNVIAPASSNGTRSPVTIQVDDSYTSPAVVPSGAYNLDSVTLVATSNYNNNSGGAFLEFASGVTLTATMLTISNYLFAQFVGAADCMTIGGVSQEFNLVVSNQAILQATGAGAFVNVTSSSGYAWVTVISATLGDGTHAVINVSGGGGAAVDTMLGTITAAAVTGSGSYVNWDTIPPAAQGSGCVITQFGGVFSTLLQGDTHALAYASSSGIDVSSGHSLSASEALNPILVLTGTLGGNEVLTIPATVGAVWDVDLSGVTLGPHTLTFDAGGTTAAVQTTHLSTGQTGVRIGVIGTNTVTRFS